MRHGLGVLALGVLALGAAGCSSSPTAGPIRVRDAWARDTAASQTTAAVYFVVDNPGDADVTITSASVPDTIAGGTMLHRIATKGSGAHAIVGMVEMGDVKVPAHGHVRFRPGSNHVMLTGLRAALRAGEHFDIVLRRSDGRTARATVTVRPV
jgi:periplasmic copper chaperone A